jgi:hypothetical protein
LPGLQLAAAFVAQRGTLAVLCGSCLCSCGTDTSTYEYHRQGSIADAGAVTADAGQNTTLTTGVPAPDTAAAALSLDAFGGAGARYWLVVSDSEVMRMNEQVGVDSRLGPFSSSYDDLYWPAVGLGKEAPFAEHLVVRTPGEGRAVADFGRVTVRLTGDPARRWSPQILPDFSIDVGAFIPGQRIGGVRRLRLHAATSGNIFREKLVLELFARLGYAAPRASYAWLSSNLWGVDISVPYLVLEAYDESFCQGNALLGGACHNLWEFSGDLGFGAFAYPGHCVSGSCDAQRALTFELQVTQTPPAEGFQAALAGSLDWEVFHEYQCLSWVLGSGQDPLKNSYNRVVFAERADGQFQYLPASLEVSLGHEGAPNVLLPGANSLASGCQADPACWAGTIATCERTLAELRAVDPVAVLGGIYAQLEALGMLRDGDTERFDAMVSYLRRRLTALPLELELNRPTPYYDCEPPLERCGRECRVAGYCVLCDPAPPSSVGDAGTDAEPPEPIDCVPPVEVPSSLSAP